ncbi:MAG: gas vesicle protein [Dehalococcoidia bacterium]
MMPDSRRSLGPPASTSLVDILDRVLDKGLVVAGDIRVSLANIELLTIRIRLLVCSIDKATEIGLDWWRRDGFLSSTAAEQAEATAALQARVAALEQQLATDALSDVPPPPPARRSSRRRDPGTGG